MFPNWVLIDVWLKPAAVMITSGMSFNLSSRNCACRKSQPSIAGIIRSSNMTDGFKPPGSFVRADHPSLAVETPYPSL